MRSHSQPALAQRLPPETFFIASAIFHYLGPAFATLLFAHVAPIGVAWLRITSAALIFAFWQRPWRLFCELRQEGRRTVIALGVVLAAMNITFYLALSRLPLATVAAIEFLGPIALAVFGLRGRRNTFALALAAAGVTQLVHLGGEGAAIGYVFAFANCALFALYVVLGHRIAEGGGSRGIHCLGFAMLVAAIAASPIGIADAASAFMSPSLLAAAIGVGLCSSVIPYVLDQFAMARLTRGTFALMLTLLPATATVVGVLVLRQIPTPSECAGIALVIAGVTLHRRAT
ncbi:MAG TPA: EamA family transporter [Steroidobacteraceae bacterium]|nr:EamA family transporter [Steroidobacteraceae bacterium]